MHVQTVTQIQSQECVGHIKQHFMTASPVTYVKCCVMLYQTFGDLDLGAIWRTTTFKYVYLASNELTKTSVGLSTSNIYVLRENSSLNPDSHVGYIYH